MRFPYQHMPLPPGESGLEYRPLLEVVARGPRGSVILPMLVDSGADESMLPSAFVRRIGAPFSGERMDLHGIGHSSLRGVEIAHVEIEFGEGRFKFRSRVTTHPLVTLPILGHRDFFLTYYVAFDARERAFYVNDL